MLITHKNVEEYEQKEDLTEEEIKNLEEYVERKQRIPRRKEWQQNNLAHAEEVLYKAKRKEDAVQ